ncbi:MAG: hypothetical protein WC516_04380 [Patescibacteria group bacterium]|jgi:hypothetical protein
MIYDIQITKGGNLIARDWNSEAADFVNEDICKEEIQLNLSSTVCLSVGVTLRDIFVLLSRDITTFSIITGCPFLDELIIEALLEPTINKDKDKENISVLELSRFVTINNSEMFWNFDFHGCGQDEQYAVEFSPLNELSIIPIILDENVSIINAETDEIVLKTKMSYTLADLIIGIVEELAFIGPPDIKAYALQELKSRAQDVSKGVSFEDFSKKIDEQMEQNKIPCKWCGNDARSQHFDKPNDICGECFEKTKEN